MEKEVCTIEKWYLRWKNAKPISKPYLTSKTPYFTPCRKPQSGGKLVDNMVHAGGECYNENVPLTFHLSSNRICYSANHTLNQPSKCINFEEHSRKNAEF